MKKPSRHQELFNDLSTITDLKQQVYQTTRSSFINLQKVIDEFVANYQSFMKGKNANSKIPFEANTIGEFEVELKFGGDVLIFLMHSNIFEFPRDHEVMKTSYVKEDKTRSYHGIINIYNFLADSFKYNRVNDAGYLIGRLFVNMDKHYFVEGKKELGFIYNDFGKNEVNDQSMLEVTEAAIDYTINFDLLTPPYDSVKYVSVDAIKTTLDTISLKTGKRLGFKFQADME